MRLTYKQVESALEQARTKIEDIRATGLHTQIAEAHLHRATEMITEAHLFDKVRQRRNARISLQKAQQRIADALAEAESIGPRRLQLMQRQQTLTGQLCVLRARLTPLHNWIAQMSEENSLTISPDLLELSNTVVLLFEDIERLVTQMEEELTTQQWDVATHTWQHATDQIREIEVTLSSILPLLPNQD